MAARGGPRPGDRAELRTGEFQLLITQMRATMEAAPGVGLAAPQVGVSIQIGNEFEKASASLMIETFA